MIIRRGPRRGAGQERRESRWPGDAKRKGGCQQGRSRVRASHAMARRPQVRTRSFSQRNSAGTGLAMMDTEHSWLGPKDQDPTPSGSIRPEIAAAEPAPRWVWEIGPNRDEAIVPIVPHDGGGHRVWLLTVALLAALGFGWIGGSNYIVFSTLIDQSWRQGSPQRGRRADHPR